ncbi:phage terminase large subunit-like protein [Lysinibacillus composti]|uniref:Terminase large subunit n=1 Tax=Lysinibacillus composti TaxID=720633 RepID=A0A3N9UIU1_9BACI|nr:terminase TerL endonuclease subunit [Lysinibacillus composti]MBM7607565.1 phage terminase large subunit-like protein [Lysinibacillus composti]RQW75930.1 terminase large subunit [Lysinibacillus composti]
MNNYILEYYEKIQSGEIVACRRIKQQYGKLVDQINNPVEPYEFDIELATKPIEFIETFCRQAQGKNMGKPLKLDLFQKAKLQAIYGFVEKESRMRQYREVIDIRGRKNGKTTENSAISIFMQVGDGEGSAECYFIATKLDQAKKGFNEAYKMVSQSPLLSKYIKKRKTDLYFSPTYSSIQPLASDSNSLDGLNSHFVTVDELAAIKDRNIYDVMKQSTSSRDQALVSSISTNGFIRDSIYDSQYAYACDVLDGKIQDNRFLAFIYELDHRDEWLDESCWIKANPGLGTIKKFDELRSFVEKAKVDASFRPTVMVKDFNMVENSSTAWLSMEKLENKETFDIGNMEFGYGIGGFDMSETTDLTAAGVLCRRRDDENIYFASMFWLPSRTIEQRANNDKIPYDLFERQGLLRASGEFKVDMRDVLKWFVELREDYDIYIPWIGYDPWHVDDSLLEEFQGQFGKDSMIKVRQGAVTLSTPMKNLEADLDAKLINYNNNNLLKMCLANTEIKVDTNGNIAPVKGRDMRKRIDGTIALLNAYTIYLDKKNEYLNMI